MEKKKKILVGGQAVLEGVMMRAPGAYATAVRRMNGEIEIERKEFTSLLEKHRLLKLPVLRGMISLFEMLRIGLGSLQWSADIAMEDAAEEDGKPVKKPGKFATAWMMTLALSIGIFAFFVLPLWLTTRLFEVERTAIYFNLMSGMIRIAVFLAYIWGISLMKEIRRVFEYHGAEHKMVFAFENGCPLTPVEGGRFIRFHPRCGTSFLLIVMLVAMLVFAMIDTVVIAIYGSTSLPIRLVSHLPLIPIVAGIGYEAIKLSGKYATTVLGRVLIAPGLWLQRVTTKEPDESQLEVAAEALKSALGDKYEELIGGEFEAETIQ